MWDTELFITIFYFIFVLDDYFHSIMNVLSEDCSSAVSQQVHEYNLVALHVLHSHSKFPGLSHCSFLNALVVALCNHCRNIWLHYFHISCVSVWWGKSEWSFSFRWTFLLLVCDIQRSYVSFVSTTLSLWKSLKSFS